MAKKSPPRVLHLATYGFYLPNQSREPMLLSGIALARRQPRSHRRRQREHPFRIVDGALGGVAGRQHHQLGAVEVAALGFGANSSPCLARALRTAGARNVLVTLWPLDDVLARDFMADFYRNWLADANGNPTKALRDTQQQWIKQAGRSDPAAWAPSVVGDRMTAVQSR